MPMLDDKIMTRDEIVSRRFEAMHMRWPERMIEFCQKEMLILAAPKIPKGLLNG